MGRRKVVSGVISLLFPAWWNVMGHQGHKDVWWLFIFLWRKMGLKEGSWLGQRDTSYIRAELGLEWGSFSMRPSLTTILLPTPGPISVHSSSVGLPSLLAWRATLYFRRFSCPAHLTQCYYRVFQSLQQSVSSSRTGTESSPLQAQYLAWCLMHLDAQCWFMKAIVLITKAVLLGFGIQTLCI